jgi:carbamate kinase
MRIVAALGGNALIRRGETGSIGVQRANVRRSAAALADLVEHGHELVVTHGNGPQVGFLAIEAEAARAIVPPPPLDVLVAETQGGIGYLIVQALRGELARRRLDRPVACVLTETVVDSADPAFAVPTKPIGPVYDEPTARALAREHGWTIARDGSGWRRVVASPRPSAIVEASTIRALADAGTIVVASGGGGIPVCLGDGALVGVEAVVDKDLEAVLLATAVVADALLLLTDVPAALLGWGSPDPIAIRRMTATAAAAGVANGTFAVGSMGPKVQAAAEFATQTGHIAAIGALEDPVGVLAGRSGTLVVADPVGLVAAA